MTSYPSGLGKVNGTVPAFLNPLSTIYPSDWGTLNEDVPATRLVFMWAGELPDRIPLFARPLMTTPQWRRTLVPGSFYPWEQTTGVYDATVLEVVTGNQTITEAGAIIENKHFRCRVDVRAPGVSFRNCLFTGPPSEPQANGIVVATSVTQTGLLLEDCTIAPEYPSHITNCIEGHRFTLRRVNAYHGVDLCSVIAPASQDRADVVIEGSWLHDPAMFNTSTQPDNVTHNDVIQWHGMKGLKVDGCRLEGWCAEDIGDINTPPVGTWPDALESGNPWFPNRWAQGAAVMASPARALFDDFEFTNNWVNGTAVGLNLTRDDGMFPDCGVISGNRFGYDWRLGADFAVLAKTHQTMVLEDNYRWNPDDPWDQSISFNVRKAG